MGLLAEEIVKDDPGQEAVLGGLLIAVVCGWFARRDADVPGGTAPGCHGPGAPPGIFEGIATTKGYTTYYEVPAPVAGVNAGRTLFHVR